jgi:hypothetical protein
VERLEHRLRASDEVRRGREVALGLVDQGIEVPEQVAQVGRQAADVAERRMQVVRHGLQVAHERPGVDRELAEPVERGARLAQEGREDQHRLGQ